MKTLKTGSKGTDVRSLQQNLLLSGYPVIVDGIFGTATEKALIQFQIDNNLAPDGLAGTNTLAVLNDLQNSQPVMGIDVSHYNGIIDWNKVDQKQVKFVYCKASQGKSYRDEMLQANMNELKRLNIIRGTYHFFTFKDVTAIDQVNNFINAGIDFTQPGTLPPVLDIEWQQSDTLNQYIKNNLTLCINKLNDWLVGVKNATGRQPIIYTNANFWKDYLDDHPGFGNYPLWISSYRNDLPALASGWKDYLIWQYTANGTISGINGNVDKNKFNGTLKQLRKLALL